MNLKDLENQAKAIAATVRDYCSKAVAPLMARMDELETTVKALAERPTEIIFSEAEIEKAAALVASKIPPPKDGAPGEKGEQGERGADGKSVTLDEVKALVEAIEIPTPKDGAPGEKGEQGERGADGKSVSLEELDIALSDIVDAKISNINWPEAVNFEQVKTLVDAGLMRFKETMPLPTNGKDGQPGKSFTLEEVQELVNKAVADNEAKRQAPETVTIEQAQKMVDEAVTKAVAAIQLPRDGKDGTDGRDAVALEILPAIDTNKSYPRNTYAIHKGGLFRTFEKSEAMRGWECLVEGVAEINFQKISERKFNLQVVRSSGVVDEHEAYIPTMLHKGVLKEGKEYEQGDVVTWAGSQWHCEIPTTEKPKAEYAEGEVKHWTLVVKRGRDGKNGTNGRDLVNGMKI